MSDAEKSAALQKLEYASKANNGTVAVMALNIVLAAAGIAIPFPASMILPLISMSNSHMLDDILGEFEFLNATGSDGAQFDFRWKIDPSGYVYDTTTNEKIEGATVTAYWIPSDGSDTFFDEIPADDNYGMLPSGIR